jgi:hypothetical protein
MSEPEKKSSFLLYLIIAGAIFFFIAFLVIPNFVREPWTSPANACINNLRQIDNAKNQWALEHNAKSNDIITINDIRPYIERERNNSFIKLDAKGNFPKCPSGGTYTIGKVGEPPTCSLGTTVTPAHVLP